MKKLFCSLIGAILLFASGCITEGDQDVDVSQHYNSVLENQEGDETCKTIKKDLDALHDDLKALEKVRGKSLDRDVYVALDKARQAMDARDYQALNKYYGQALEFIRDHLVDEAAVEEYRQALVSIGKRLKYEGACEEAWREVRAYQLERILKRIIIPEMEFSPPQTLVDAVDFFKQASRDYDLESIPVEKRGISLVLKIASANTTLDTGEDDPFAVTSDNSNIPVIPQLSARFISLYDALVLICDVTGYQFNLRHGFIMIEPLKEDNHESSPGLFDKGESSSGLYE